MMAVNIPLMKGILLFFAAFTLLFGALFLFSPQTITKMTEWGNKVLFAPVNTVRRNGVLGVLLLVLGIVLIAILLSI